MQILPRRIPPQGTTEVGVLVSEWSVREGRAHADDVAAATRKNRIAVLGGLDYAARSFDGLRIVLLDKHGCAVLEQAVTGPFSDPQVEEPGAIETLLGPLFELVEKGIGQLAGKE
jgi:AsmA protein